MDKKDIKNIVKSKLTSGRSLGNWYFKRLKICKSCEHNSSNSEALGTQAKVNEVLSMGNPVCNLCTCTIKDLAKVRDISCEAGKWGTEDKRVSTVGSSGISYTAEKLYSPEDVELIKSQKSEDTFYITYGTKPRFSDGKVVVGLSNFKGELSDLATSSSCGCTKPSVSKEGDTYVFTVEYDMKRLSTFRKTAIFTAKDVESGKIFNIVFKLTGKVVTNE